MTWNIRRFKTVTWYVRAISHMETSRKIMLKHTATTSQTKN